MGDIGCGLENSEPQDKKPSAVTAPLTLSRNLHTEVIEDFIGLGPQDIAAFMIHTLLRPKETFANDPFASSS